MAAQANADERLQLSKVTSGYTFFNRPGATSAEQNADIAECAAMAAQLVSGMVAANSANQGLALAILSAGPESAVHRSGIENCMVVRGWRVVRTPKEEGAVLAKLPARELAGRLAPWIGADTPPGEIVRTWRNEAATAATDRYDNPMFGSENGSLSLLAAGDVKLASAADVYMKPKIDKRWPTKKLGPKEFTKAPADAAIVIVETRGLSFANGIGLHFARVADSGVAHPASIDHAPEEIDATVGLLFNNSKGNWLAYAVPAGRWRISSLGSLPVLSTCLGSPGFEVAAGEIVYAGAFDMGADTIGPDLSLAPVQAWLVGQPAAEKVKAAVYSNGWTGVCAGQSMYALEMAGVPFREGYTWGGAYRAPTSITPPVKASAN